MNKPRPIATGRWECVALLPDSVQVKVIARYGVWPCIELLEVREIRSGVSVLSCLSENAKAYVVTQVVSALEAELDSAAEAAGHVGRL